MKYLPFLTIQNVMNLCTLSRKHKTDISLNAGCKKDNAVDYLLKIIYNLKFRTIL